MTAGLSRRSPSPTVIVAAAGYGKTTTLQADPMPGTARYRARDLLTTSRGLERATRVCVDDLDRLAPHEQAVVLSRLVEVQPREGILVASRTPLDRAGRQALGSGFTERGPRYLALSPYRIARVLREEYDIRDPEAAGRTHEITAGWPRLVHGVAGELARRPDADPVRALARPGSAFGDWLSAVVLDSLDEQTRTILTCVAGLGCCTQRLLDRIAGRAGLGGVDGVVARLHGLGLLVPGPALGDNGALRLVPLVEATLAGCCDRGATGWSEAAQIFEAEGFTDAAVRAYARAGEGHHVRRLLSVHGDELVRAGHADVVVEALAGDGPRRPVPVQRTYATALNAAGNPTAALRALQPLVERAASGAWSVRLAADVASVRYVRGDFAGALEALSRAGDLQDRCVPAAEAVEWRSCRVRVLAMLGRREEAEAEAMTALGTAEQDGDPGLLATACLAAAAVTSGARKEAHLSEALRGARAADDAVTAARVLVNQSYLLLASGRFADAVPVAREAVRVADFASRSGRRPAALHNLAEALMRIGEYDEARWHLERAVVAARRLGPERCATGTLGLAEVERHVGHDDHARALFAEVIALATASGERQVLVPALAGLARVEAPMASDRALSLAGEACRLATPALLPSALTSLGWAAMGGGDRESATRHAREAVTAARQINAHDLLADAFELQAACHDDPAVARAVYAEAMAIWSAGGARPAAYRIEVLLGRLPGADVVTRSRAREAARGLQRMGITSVEGLPVTDRPASAPLRIAVVGGFDVTVDGEPVPQRAWRSRQARTLIKVLAAHRGRPVTRSALCELLWPDDDPAKTSHRLSVLLATVRGALDPTKSSPPDQYVAADLVGIRLDLSHVDLDAQELLLDAQSAAELLDAGDAERAEEILADIDDRYHGDAFPDEPCEPWSDALREEVRAAWLRSLRRLVTLRRQRGRGGDTQALLVRILIADPYDESAHRLLVGTLARTGRHGEARRAFARWEAAMRDIDAPAPDPALLARTL